MKKILMITSYFTREENGLSDYCVNIFDALKTKSQVDVLTTEGIISDQDNVYPVVGNWFSSDILKIIEFSKTTDIILLQYVASMYSKKGGVNFLLPLVMLYLKILKKKKIYMMVHEYAYPFLPDLKSYTLAIIHRILMFLLVTSSERVYASTNFFVKSLKKYTLNKSKVLLAQVPASIRKYSYTQEERNELFQRDSVKPGKKLLLLGGFHPSKNMVAAYDLLLEKIDFQLIHIGVEKEEVEEKCLGVNLKDSAILGKLSERDVSIYLQEVDYIWCYFVDGASLRRSTLASGVLHQTNILTTKSKNTEKEILELPNIYSSSCKINDFKKLVIGKLKSETPKHNVKPLITFEEIADRILS